MSEQLKPPFSVETATLKVQRAEDLWNTKDPARIALAYTESSVWRNRSEFVSGSKAITELLAKKWRHELDYRLKKELFAFTDNRIAVHFEYEYRNDRDQWFRAYGNEHWSFDTDGLMQIRDASINEHTISRAERRIF